MKKAKKQPGTAQIAASDEVDGLDELATALRTALSAITNRIRAGKAKPSDAKEAVNIVTEMRKLNAAKAKRTNELTLAQVVAWLRTQPKDTQAKLTRELHSMGRGGGVL